MAHKIEIKRLNNFDINDLFTVINECNQLEPMTIMNCWMTCNFFKENSYIMHVNHELAGYIIAADNGKDIVILNMGIVEKHRHVGHSQLLIDAVVQGAQQKARGVQMAVNPNNTAAVNVFKKYCEDNNKEFKTKQDCLSSMNIMFCIM